MNQYAPTWPQQSADPAQTWPTVFSLGVTPPLTLQVAPPITDAGSLDLLSVILGADLGSDVPGVLLGVPAWALVSFLSDNKDELSVPFTVKGSIDNPRFSVQQSLVDQVATALSSKIGVPTVSGVGKGILGIGEKGIKGIYGIFGGKK